REANLYKESNETLRAQINRMIDREQQLEQSEQMIKNQLRELQNVQADLEETRNRLQIMTEERDSWRSRVEQVLRKYDRIDPVEYNQLKGDLSSLKEELEELKQKNVKDKEEFNKEKEQLQAEN